MTADIRQIRPSDYRPVISVIDDWWNGRHMADMLPRLFFEHFTDTSFAAVRDGELAGFLVWSDLSPSHTRPRPIFTSWASIPASAVAGWGGNSMSTSSQQCRHGAAFWSVR